MSKQEQKFKALVSFNKSIHKIGVDNSIKLYGNKRSFNKYLEKLIMKDKLDNFDIKLLNEKELKEYNKIKSCNVFSKRASILYLIDNLDNLSIDLKELKDAIYLHEQKL